MKEKASLSLVRHINSEIVLTYSTPGLRAGAALSAVCLAGWIAAELILARRRKRKGHGG